MRTTHPAERPHRNHGLFSDHYLNVTLPGRPDWLALAGEARGAMEEISRVLDEGGLTHAAHLEPLREYATVQEVLAIRRELTGSPA